MRYQKANEILPVELVELIQDYIDGEYVYIPRKQENKKGLGGNFPGKGGTSVKKYRNICKI